MELVKKNIVSIICGVVAIVAIVASVFPLGGYIEELQKSLETSKGDHSSLESLRTKPRNQPILKLDETTPQPLGMFPSKDVIAKAAAVVKEVEAQSIKMRDAAVKMNRRTILVPGSLPNPVPPFDLRFRDTYGPLVSAPVVNNVPSGEPPPLLKEYGGGVLPHASMIEMEKARRVQEINETKVQRDPRGGISNQAEIAELIAEVNAKVPADMRRAVADKSLFYVEVTPTGGTGPTIDVAPGVIGAARPTQPAVWWAQVLLWIQRDALQAVKEVNTAPLENGQKPKNLTEAPIKRVLRINVPVGTFITAAGQAPAAAADPTAAADAALPKVVQASPTGRVSNGMYDVVHFQITADVEVDKLPQIIRSISHNRLMSVFHVDAKYVDASALQLAGYYYGDRPVAQVTLHCEALLLRHWTVALMPPQIRTLLQIPEPAAPGAAPAAPAPPTAMAQ